MTPQMRPKTLARQICFLENYLMFPTVTGAAARANVLLGTIYKWRRASPAFKSAFERIAAQHARRRDVKRSIRCLGHLPVLKTDLPIKSITWAESP